METEEKIIRAALRQFEERGFTAATTKAIAADAGVAEVTLFRIFGDKQTLFIRVLQTVAAEFGLMKIPDAATGDFRRDMQTLCQGLLRHFIRYNALFRMLIFEVKNHEDIRLVLRDVRGRSLLNMQALAGRYIGTSGAELAGRVECMGNALMGASLSYCVFHSTEDANAFIQTHAGMIADAFIRQATDSKENRQ